MVLFIYIHQRVDFSHYSLSQASIVVNKSTLSHLKINVPNIWIIDIFSCLIQNEEKEDFAPVALPHPTKWHTYFSSWGAGLRPLLPAQSLRGHGPSTDHVEGGHIHPKHTAEVKAQTETHSQSSVAGSTEQEEKRQRVFPRSFYRQRNSVVSVPLALTNIVQVIFYQVKTREETKVFSEREWFVNRYNKHNNNTNNSSKWHLRSIHYVTYPMAKHFT